MISLLDLRHLGIKRIRLYLYNLGQSSVFAFERQASLSRFHFIFYDQMCWFIYLRLHLDSTTQLTIKSVEDPIGYFKVMIGWVNFEVYRNYFAPTLKNVKNCLVLKTVLFKNDGCWTVLEGPNYGPSALKTHRRANKKILRNC